MYAKSCKIPLGSTGLQQWPTSGGNSPNPHLHKPFGRLDDQRCIFQIIPAWKKIIEERGADITLNFGDICFTEFFPDPEEGSIIVMQNLG